MKPNRFVVLAIIGYGFLAAAAIAFLVWGQDGSSRPGESWDVWTQRIALSSRIINLGILLGGGAPATCATFAGSRHNESQAR
jgi:hypothetical protein